MEKWVRGAVIGRGSFGTVNLAMGMRKIDPQMPLVMAVKSATLSQSSSLKKEREILAQLQDCPQILRCFGHDVTAEKGELLYNVFLEYVSGGNLAELGQLPESDVRSYTASILKGLVHIHKKGYVHCDIKLRNILVCSSPEEVKIADFGMAKETGEKIGGGICLLGTPLYMAPESVANREYEPPSDIWSLGCAVVEMITGKPAWRCAADDNVNALLFRIAFGDELPEIPSELSEEGRDFLHRCFVRDPTKRWTAEMLLQHPFVGKGLMKESVLNSKPSPRSVFDSMAWDSLQSSLLLDSFVGSEREFDGIGNSSPADRIRELATGQKPNWLGCEDGWITSRKKAESMEIQEVGCSVSVRDDSVQVLKEMMVMEGKRAKNSDSGMMMMMMDLVASTSSTVNEIEPLDVSRSDHMNKFWYCRGRGITRSGKVDVFDYGKIGGCGLLELSWKNWDCNCNISCSISNKFKHRGIY